VRKKDIVVGFFVLVAFLVALTIIPGLDILAWHLLRPTGFWERLVLLVVEAITLWPRVILAVLLWAGFIKLAEVISD
jgi:hypothetical protein